MTPSIPPNEPVPWLDWRGAEAAPEGSTVHTLAAWFRGYVMQPHPDLGRSGHVCPYMAQASRLNLVRLATCDLDPRDGAGMRRLLIAALAAFDAVPCPEPKRVFRTVVVAFHGCTSPEDIAAIERAQHGLRYRAALGGRMIGLFESGSKQPGIANRAFPSFRCPVPVIAIRTLVELDAPFVLRNPPMIPTYLWRFGASGRRRIAAALVERIADRWRSLTGAPAQ